MNTISTDKAPSALGPYSQAIKAGNMVFCSGQVALDPQSGKMVEGDVVAQMRQCLANLRAVLEAAGASWKDVVKTTIFLKDLEDFNRINDVYASELGDLRPARACVEVSRLPKDALVEIEAIAYLEKAP